MNILQQVRGYFDRVQWYVSQFSLFGQNNCLVFLHHYWICLTPALAWYFTALIIKLQHTPDLALTDMIKSSWNDSNLNVIILPAPLQNNHNRPKNNSSLQIRKCLLWCSANYISRSMEIILAKTLIPVWGEWPLTKSSLILLQTRSRPDHPGPDITTHDTPKLYTAWNIFFFAQNTSACPPPLYSLNCLLMPSRSRTEEWGGSVSPIHREQTESWC